MVNISHVSYYMNMIKINTIYVWCGKLNCERVVSRNITLLLFTMFPNWNLNFYVRVTNSNAICKLNFYVSISFLYLIVFTLCKIKNNLVQIFETHLSISYLKPSLNHIIILKLSRKCFKKNVSIWLFALFFVSNIWSLILIWLKSTRG